MVEISVVIPLAPERNAEIIEHLKKQEFPRKNFEIIVEVGKNPSVNRNKGVKKAKGKIIVFADDDALVEKDYLKNVKHFFDKYKDIDIVGGPQLTPSSDRGFAKISGYALSSEFGGFGVNKRYKQGEINFNAGETEITSANLSCRKQVLDKVKFDTNLFPGEDPEFISQAKQAGFKVAYFPEIVVYHRRRANIAGLIKQISSYGKTRAERNLKETVKRPYFLVPSLFLLYGIFLLGVLLLGRLNLALISLLLLYIALDLLFSLFQAIKNKEPGTFFVLLLVYPVIHYSYGWGFIHGVLKRIINAKH